MFIGLKVTLRKNIMWEFLDRLINIALPRVKDFKGITSNFDSNGNITIGIKENLIFPELDYKDKSLTESPKHMLKLTHIILGASIIFFNFRFFIKLGKTSRKYIFFKDGV
jgi:hypothetical protein